MQNNILNEDTEDNFQLRAILDQYIFHWKWFVLGVFLCLGIAFGYLRYVIPQYKASTTILVKDEKKGGGLSELSAFADMGLGGALKNNVDNEIEILKSRTLVESTVRELHLNVNLVVEGNVIDATLYDNSPISVRFIRPTAALYSSSSTLKFSSTGGGRFRLEEELNDLSLPILFDSKKEYAYGEIIKTRGGDLRILQSTIEGVSSSKFIQIVIRPLEEVVENYRSRLVISPLSKTSSVVELSLTDAVIHRAEDFLDALVRIYNEAAVNDKNAISENTSQFIAGRLALITEELDGVEQSVERFKKSNRLTDIESEAKLFIEGSSEYDKKGVEAAIQLNMVQSMLDFIKKSSNSDLLPTNVIGGDADASSLINTYNQLILDRNRLLKSATSLNPSVVKMDQQIASLRSNVVSSLGRLQSNLRIQKSDLKSEEGVLNRKVEKIPSQERQFRVIARQQKVKEELYLYLLQKREETAISLSATEPNARVIDAAKASKIPVSPKKSIIYLAALLLGILIPFGVIYLIDLLDTKIKSRLDLEGKTSVPFIGDVPSSEDPSQIMQPDSRSSSAEALRIIRTNLEFMVGKVAEGKAKTIFLTSTFPKEGKTFVSVNLAATFALSGKRVLLIGADIRNPRLDDYLTLPDRGLTNYLSSNNLDLKDLIVKYEGYEDFHVLPAGVIPPNPAELLMSKKIAGIFESLKAEYDYIIVDTAPVSLVTDTLLIAQYADCFVYVARANFLEKRMLAIPNSLYKENKLPNMCMLLNDTDSSKGYGYGYGYGVNVEKEPWYKRIWNK
ncbi:GumC family protein [Flavobacterium acetivorans]|uniref:GumC family protein n=1 Tax=Flavobacterium acetivorans TaxID=2893883 RepID=UPI001E4171C0|nr:polysaccharide biosynthesis tyrosine autokinase [Flavobacterium sp. F-29]UFH35735.1 polysaccharide biosynthesis tyrosine autokinase [Flavobacterium sp. F-29]